MNIIDQIKQEKIVAVIRAKNEQEAIDIVDACVQGGIRIIEITYTVPNASTVISKLNHQRNDHIVLGAGTVINQSMCEEAINAGAKFIVSPIFDAETASYCLGKNIPYIPGCVTPTEMVVAYNAGASMIKLFPGSQFSPGYIKSIKGPLPFLDIMPTGGVDLDNIKSWFEHGACAVGIGSALTKPAKNNNFKEITRIAKSYTNIVSDVISWQK